MKISLHKVGVGGIYETKDKRGVAVQVMRHAFGLPYFTWVALFDGEKIGSGNLNECRRLIASHASL